ncbi:MAG: hypothetical protein EAZ57_05400 [Cytophagales bacterium]|nr:MAG: hypothetical protein EAZ67_06180 [Cytophagales bacterium]TAF60982.1 MAG: hypothetical protein EAZ57_05400 [Cytophagales bacterium]
MIYRWLYVLLAVLGILLQFHQAQAQLLSDSTKIFAHIETRAEINAEQKDSEDFTVFPLQKDGVLVLQVFKHPLNETQGFTFTRYDTALQKVWTETLPLKPQLHLVHYSIQDDMIYLMFEEDRFYYDIYSINIKSGRWYPMPYQRLFKAAVSQLKVINNQLIMTGEADEQSFIMHLNPQNSEQKILSGSQYRDYYLANLSTHPSSNTFVAVLNGKTQKTKDILVCIYEANGTLIDKLEIPNNIDYSFLMFKTHIKSPEEMIIVGAYTLKQRSKPQGVFLANIKKGEKPNIKFYDFCYLNNFFSYMRPEKREKYLSKIRQKKKEGDHTRYNLDLVLDDLVVVNNQIVVSGETFTTILQDNRGMTSPMMFSAMPAFWAFNPMIYTRSSMFFFSGGPYSSFPFYGYNNFWNNGLNNSQVTQYNYKQGFVCVFDLEGKMLWDNSIPLEDLQSTMPTPYLAHGLGGSKSQLLYLEKGKLYFKNVTQSQANETVWEQTLQQPNTSDKIYDRQNEVFSHWYSDKYLYFGTQQIRSTEKQNRRRVFFLSKVRIDAPSEH